MSNKKKVEQATNDDVRWRLRGYDDDIRIYVRVQGRIVPLASAKPTAHPSDDQGVVLECIESAPNDMAAS